MNEENSKKQRVLWESEFNNIPKYLRDFGPKKGVLLVELWAWPPCVEVVLAMQH